MLNTYLQSPKCQPSNLPYVFLYRSTTLKMVSQNHQKFVVNLTTACICFSSLSACTSTCTLTCIVLCHARDRILFYFPIPSNIGFFFQFALLLFTPSPFTTIHQEFPISISFSPTIVFAQI